VHDIYPPRGPVHGNTTVTVYGAEFLDMNMQCKFGTLPRVPILAILSSTKLLCVSPVSNASAVPLELSINDQQYSYDGVRFDFLRTYTFFCSLFVC
jgi:hypothetical protein